MDILECFVRMCAEDRSKRKKDLYKHKEYETFWSKALDIIQLIIFDKKKFKKKEIVVFRKAFYWFKNNHISHKEENYITNVIVELGAIEDVDMTLVNISILDIYRKLGKKYS